MVITKYQVPQTLFQRSCRQKFPDGSEFSGHLSVDGPWSSVVVQCDVLNQNFRIYKGQSMSLLFLIARKVSSAYWLSVMIRSFVETHKARDSANSSP